MKPILIYELSFILSFFSKKYDIETINLKHFDFFLEDPENEEQLVSLFTFRDNEKQDSPSYSSKKVLPWDDISIEEYNFCLSRLSKNMVYKEKIYTIIMLIELCHSNNSFYLDRLSFVKKTSQGLGLSSSTFSVLEKLAFTSGSDKNKKNAEKHIVIIRRADLIEPPKNFTESNSQNVLAPIFSFVYIYEEKLFLVKTFEEKTKINSAPIEINKLYPMNEGDILSVSGKLLSFNELFRLYYSYSTFYPLYIEPTETTPFINFHPKNNILDIKGCSVPEDGIGFYLPVLSWIENYLLTNPKEITLNIQLDYFNTTSSKFIFEMLRRLESYNTDEIKLIVNWFFIDGDEDLEEAGLVYSDVVRIPFSLIPQEA
jgi:hypothetical protein